MGEVVLFRKAEAEAAAGKRAKKPGRSTDRYVGINVYVPPHRDRVDCGVARGAAHGILSEFGFQHTSGLNRELFRTGGIFGVRCGEEQALAMRRHLAKHLPYIEVHMVRRHGSARRAA